MMAAGELAYHSYCNTLNNDQRGQDDKRSGDLRFMSYKVTNDDSAHKSMSVRQDGSSSQPAVGHTASEYKTKPAYVKSFLSVFNCAGK